MKRIFAALALLGMAFVTAADSQVVPFPQSLPPSTVVGRMPPVAGPAQAIPFSVLTSQLAGSGSGIFGLTLSGDTNYAMLTTDRTVMINANLTAPRTVTLFAAAALATGQQICISDAFGGVTSTNTLTLARAGADTIDSATSYVLKSGFAGSCLISDGSSKWTVSNAAIGTCTTGFLLGSTGAGVNPTCQGFTNTGTGGVARTWNAKVQEIVFSVKDFGALCDGSTNDAAAIQATINAAIANGGGIVFIPGGANCRINSNVSVNSAIGITIRGGHMLSSAISTNADVEMLTVGGGRHSIEHISLLGVGTQGGNGPAASTNSSALHITNTCVDCFVNRTYAAGGFVGIWNDGVDTILQETVATQNYRTSVYTTNNALWMIRSKIDNPWPVSVPTLGASVAAWAATTAYNVGDVRLHPSNFYMQVRVAGTSGGAAPTLQNFGTDIVDGGGTLRWRLASSLQGAALEITSGASEVHVMQSDFSGAQGRGAIVIDNDLATTAPFAISIMGGVVSQSVQSGIRAIAGNGLQVGGGIEFGQCVAAGCSSVELAATWGSDASIVNSYGLGGAANGVLISGGTNTTIANNNLFGYTTAVNVAAAVTKFSIVGNDVGTSTKFGVNTTGINVAAGASDNYVIFGNITTGATTGVTDAGTGTAKVVQTNEGDFTARKVISSAIGWLQTTPTTVAALPACNAGSKGARSFVTDNATALAFAAVITAGAAIQTPVYCDGTVWRQG